MRPRTADRRQGATCRPVRTETEGHRSEYRGRLHERGSGEFMAVVPQRAVLPSGFDIFSPVTDQPVDFVDASPCLPVRAHDLISQAFADADRPPQPRGAVDPPWHPLGEVVFESLIHSSGEAFGRRGVGTKRRHAVHVILGPASPISEMPLRRHRGRRNTRRRCSSDRRAARESGRCV